MLQLHKLKREEGGGYRCLASVPSVPGLNRSQLVNVAVFGEALELVSVFKLSGGQKSPAALGRSGVGRGWRAGRMCCLNPPCPHTGPPWMALREKKMWVKENSVLNLSCEASGHPRPSIVWSVHGTVSGCTATSQAPGHPLAGSAATTRHPPTPEPRLLPCRQVSKTRSRRVS